MFDVIYISYDEPNADENWELLLDKAPHAMRVHGVKGIPQAHIEAAKQVSTSHFYCVDADNVVVDSFDFPDKSRIVDFQVDDKRVHVWRCQNVINGLVYGYGGIKLFPTDHVEHIKEYSVDFTTSAAVRHGFKIQPDLASVTHFNTSAYNAWKSGFRECVKLSSNIIHNSDKRSINRMNIWMNIGLDEEYGDSCILGARVGVLYGLINQNTEEKLTNINNFEWCKEFYDNLEFANYFDDTLLKELSSYNIEPMLFTPEQSMFIKYIMNKV